MAKKILVVDDEELVTKSLLKLLKTKGYAVIIAGSGKEALEKAQKDDFDLLICDIRMPQMDGIETVKKIRDCFKSSSRKLPAEILITGYVEADKYDMALDLEVSDYLSKPFNNEQFLQAVKKAIG